MGKRRKGGAEKCAKAKEKEKRNIFRLRQELLQWELEQLAQPNIGSSHRRGERKTAGWSVPDQCIKKSRIENIVDPGLPFFIHRIYAGHAAVHAVVS